MSDSPEPESTPEETSDVSPLEEASTPSETKPAADDLPEDFELTPELVEEEAIRSDFVLRWSGVLLGIMLGCTVISSTQTLVHVKAGEYLTSHGFLPDGTDPFAYTTEGRVWRNHSWLFDLLLSGIYNVTGAWGLSLFKALMVGSIVWCVVTVSRPRTPTWWTAIVAVVTLIALIPFLSVTSELMTILGCALLMRLFTGWRYQSDLSLNWKIAILFLVWANLDSRMFLGLVLLLLLSVGETLRWKEQEGVPILPAKVLWPTLGVAFLVSLINPFGWHAWMSAVDLYSVTDPLVREYYADTAAVYRVFSYPIWTEAYWQILTIPFVMVLTVAGFAAAALFLNYDKLVLSELLATVGFVAIGSFTLRDVGPALPIMAVFISLNCQDWYRGSFKQEYSVNQFELLFSRGGRALTVLAFMVVAWLGMTGRLFEGSTRTIGLGFENLLENSLSGISEDLESSYDNQPFNFSISQGDVLIWADQKVFIDSRLGLFSGTSSDLETGELSEIDVIGVHRQTREALRRAETEEDALAARETWRSSFEKYQITHALPRVAGGNPDYVTYNDLLINPEFTLATLTPSVAVFYRSNLSDETFLSYVDRDKYEAFLSDHRINFLGEAFDEDVAVEESMTRGVFPQPESAYVSYLTAAREQIPAPLVLAGHYLQHLDQSIQGAYQMDFKTELAFSYLSIRNANLALTENPESSSAFTKLGQAYYYLGMIEQRYCALNRIPYDVSMRFLQSHQALNQALIGNPNDLVALNILRLIAITRNKPETALILAQRILEVPPDPTGQQNVPDELRESYQEFIDQVEPQVEQLYEEAQKQIDQGAEPLIVAAGLGARGCPFRALEMFDSSETEIPPNSELELVYGLTLLEVGRIEEAYNTLLKLEPMIEQFPLDQRIPYLGFLSIVALGHADYSTAMDFKETQTETQQTARFGQTVFPTIPLSTDPELYSLTRFRSWQQMSGVQDQTSFHLWQQAVYQLEQGKNQAARLLLERALEVSPNSRYRILLVEYLGCLSDEPIDAFAPSDRIPVHADLFVEDADGEERGSEPTN